jgi:hypothetical protein
MDGSTPVVEFDGAFLQRGFVEQAPELVEVPTRADKWHESPAAFGCSVLTAAIPDEALHHQRSRRSTDVKKS